VDLATFRSEFLLDLDFVEYDGQDRPAHAGEVAAAERQLQVKFPDPYRRFLSCFRFLIVEARQDVWPRDQGAVPLEEFWRHQYGVYVLGIGDLPDPFFHVGRGIQLIRDNLERPRLPAVPVIGTPNNVSMYCIGADEQMYFWSGQEADRFDPMNKGFYDVLVDLMAWLRRNKERLKSGPAKHRGHPVTRKPARSKKA
jgi:hypothetical protein